VPKQLSLEQEHWLENALNPFSDYSKTAARMPSHESVSTAVKNVQKIMDVNAPDIEPLGATTWTANVFLMPTDATIGTASRLRAATLDGVNVANPSDLPFVSGTLLSGLLMVVKAWDSPPAGSDSANPFSPSFVPANAEFQFITLADAWNGEGAARLTSAGYEIVDNTAELYRAGNMVNWRKSSAAVDLPLNVLAGVVVDRRDAMRVFTGFPQDLATAFRVPGSTSRRFTEGTYVVGTFNHNKENFELPNGLGCCTLAASRPLSATRPALFLGGITDSDPELGVVPNFFTYTHLDHSGSFCTGLSPQTTFTITLKATVEIIPNANSVLIDFASPSIPYNPRVDELYQKIVSELPPSVPVADNNAGDFFKKIVNVATPLVSSLFPSAAPIIGAASGLANKGIDALSRNRQRKKAQKKNQANSKKLTKAEISAEIQRLNRMLRNMK
jgi:hypothetical protein